MSAPWPLFPTTVIGSMPRPGFVRDLLGARPPVDAPDPTAGVDWFTWPEVTPRP